MILWFLLNPSKQNPLLKLIWSRSPLTSTLLNPMINSQSCYELVWEISDTFISPSCLTHALPWLPGCPPQSSAVLGFLFSLISSQRPVADCSQTAISQFSSSTFPLLYAPVVISSSLPALITTHLPRSTTTYLQPRFLTWIPDSFTVLKLSTQHFHLSITTVNCVQI